MRAVIRSSDRTKSNHGALMAFVRKKGAYHYLVESRREGASVRQAVVAYLGRWEAPAEALPGMPVEIARQRQEAQQARVRAETFRPAAFGRARSPAAGRDTLPPRAELPVS